MKKSRKEFKYKKLVKCQFELAYLGFYGLYVYNPDIGRKPWPKTGSNI